MKLIGISLYAILLIVVGAIWRGYVLSVMWAWFIVTALHAPALSVAQAIGLALVVSALTYNPDDSSSDSESEGHPLVHATAQVIFTPLVFLAFGAIVKNFI